MLDRRRFLIGAGGLLTARFVHQARAFSRNVGKPLVLPPAKRPEETLYVYRQECSSFDAEWRVSLGPNQPFAPPPPTWRERLRSLGHCLDTDDDVERVCIQEGLEPNDLDKRLDGLAGRMHGTTSPAPRRRRFTCSRSSFDRR